MGSLNKVFIIGSLGRDPETRNMADGKPVVNLNIATSESWKDKSTGEKKEKTEWHRVVIFNENLARIAQQYLKKGSTVYIEGQLQTRKWTDQSGQDKYTTEIVLQNYRGELTMLGSKQQSSGGHANHDGTGGDNYGSQGNPPANNMAATGDLDDEIPF